MVHFATTTVLDPVKSITPFGVGTSVTAQPVLVVRDAGVDNDLLDTICEFLGLGVEHIGSDDDVGPMLRAMRPIAVIADLAGQSQDGYHVMKTTGAYDPDLPVLLLTDGDPALLGAVDAVQEAWGLTRVATVTGKGDMAAFVDFLCHAARDAGMGRLMRI